MDKLKKKPLSFIKFVVILLFISVASALIYREFFKKEKEEVKDESLTFVFDAGEGWDDSEPCTVVQNIQYVYYTGSDPLWKENNKFGLYIYAEDKDFFEIAQNLVNSNGGEWGYVLIPYNVKDYDEGKWGRVFDQLIEKKMIPIIQLWNVDIADYQEQTRKAAEFLNTFIWPIKYRYISVYNEPNDSEFWNGRADPYEYAEVLDYTIRVFKEVNPDFYMLNGAFNVSASANDNL